MAKPRIQSPASIPEDRELVESVARLVGSERTETIAWKRIAQLLLEAGIRKRSGEPLLDVLGDEVVGRSRAIFEATFDFIKHDPVEKAQGLPILSVERALARVNASTPDEMQRFVGRLRRALRRAVTGKRRAGRPKRASDEAIRGAFDTALAAIREPLGDFTAGTSKEKLLRDSSVEKDLFGPSGAAIAKAVGMFEREFQRAAKSDPKLMIRWLAQPPKQFAKMLVRHQLGDKNGPLGKRTVERALRKRRAKTRAT